MLILVFIGYYRIKIKVNFTSHTKLQNYEQKIPQNTLYINTAENLSLHSKIAKSSKVLLKKSFCGDVCTRLARRCMENIKK